VSRVLSFGEFKGKDETHLDGTEKIPEVLPRGHEGGVALEHVRGQHPTGGVRLLGVEVGPSGLPQLRIECESPAICLGVPGCVGER